MTDTPSPPKSRSRAALIGRATSGAYSDAPALVEAIVSESVGVRAWRPARAGLLRSVHEGKPRVWMTNEEFRFWITSQTAVARKLKEGVKPLDEVGISSGRKLRILKGAPVDKVEALACAHLAMRLPVPAVLDSDDFGAWVEARFGAAKAISEWLQLRPEIITDRVRGFDVKGGVRRERTVGIQLVRALAWVDLVGPVCPYGIGMQVDAFPVDEVEA